MKTDAFVMITCFYDYLNRIGGVIPYHATRNNEGGRDFYWKTEEATIDLGFDGDGHCSYYAKFADGTELIEDKCTGVPLPDKILNVIKKRKN